MAAAARRPPPAGSAQDEVRRLVARGADLHPRVVVDGRLAGRPLLGGDLVDGHALRRVGRLVDGVLVVEARHRAVDGGAGGVVHGAHDQADRRGGRGASAGPVPGDRGGVVPEPQDSRIAHVGHLLFAGGGWGNDPMLRSGAAWPKRPAGPSAWVSVPRRAVSPRSRGRRASGPTGGGGPGGRGCPPGGG